MGNAHLGAHLEYSVCGGGGNSPELGETTGHHHISQLVVGRDRAECSTPLGDRVWRAAQYRKSRECTPDRVKILLSALTSHWLDDHQRAVRGETLACVPDGPGGVAHIVQAVEKSDQIISSSWIGLGATD